MIVKIVFNMQSRVFPRLFFLTFMLLSLCTWDTTSIILVNVSKPLQLSFVHFLLLILSGIETRTYRPQFISADKNSFVYQISDLCSTILQSTVPHRKFFYSYLRFYSTIQDLVLLLFVFPLFIFSSVFQFFFFFFFPVLCLITRVASSAYRRSLIFLPLSVILPF